VGWGIQAWGALQSRAVTGRAAARAASGPAAKRSPGASVGAPAAADPRGAPETPVRRRRGGGSDNADYRTLEKGHSSSRGVGLLRSATRAEFLWLRSMAELGLRSLEGNAGRPDRF
jgi:hypothetical protein